MVITQLIHSHDTATPRPTERGDKPKVVIAGGGFGGLYSALRLAELAREGQPAHAGPAVDITLVDRSERFVFLPLLYELAVGEAQKARLGLAWLGLI